MGELCPFEPAFQGGLWLDGIPLPLVVSLACLFEGMILSFQGGILP
jgi:hypothetical protein